MQVELQRFAEAFNSEDELRRHVATLLGKLGDNRNIEITHGAQECGKDIVFYSRDAIGDWILNACVVKNAKIMGSADDKGARNVLIQVEQALDTPFLKSSGESESVSRVYVISPYDCSQSTMHSIQGKLRDRSGQVTFLCGSRLLEKFVQSWPEFLVFESTLLGAYVAALQKRLDQDDPIGFLMSHHEFISAGQKTLSNVYVRQGFLKTLTTVTLLVDVPQFSILRRALQENRLNQIIESLIFVSNLLTHAQAWETGNYESAKKYSTQLRELARSLSDSWRSRYDVLRTTSLERGKVASSIKKAYIRPRGFDWLQVQELEQAVGKAIDSLVTRIARANGFAQSRRRMLDALHSEEHLNYCRVQEIVHAFPHGFRIERGTRYDVRLPDDLLEQVTGSVLITAPAGLGKTSFCKWNTLTDVSRLTQRTSETIPIYVALHQLSTASITNYSEVFLRTTEIQDLFESAKKNGRHVRVYLDGLDEVTTVDQQQKLMFLASKMADDFPELQIVITGRDYVSGPALRWVPRVNLAKLTDDQVSELIENWIGDDRDVLSDFKAQLSKVGTLKPLMRIPLLGTLIIAVYKRMRSLPENKVKLYEIFMELMCGGWDLVKNVRRESKFGPNVKLGVLTTLAGILQRSNKREAVEADLKIAVTNTVFALGEKWKSLLDELLEDGLLVRTTFGVAFSHLSFQEFLAAKDLADPAEDRTSTILKSFLQGDDRWREVLSFYVAMSNKPDEMAAWIKRLSGDETYIREDFLLKRMADSSPGWVRSKEILTKNSGNRDL